MARRYWLSPIIGTGGMIPRDPVRAKLLDLGVDHIALIPTSPTTGLPLFNWALCLVAASDFTTLLADGQLEDMPNISLDSPVSVLSAAARNRMLNFAIGHGVDTTGVTLQTTFRQVLRRIGQTLDAGWDEANMALRDIP